MMSTKSLKNIDEAFDKKKISKDVDGIIGDAKKKMGFYLDPTFGMQEELVRTVMNGELMIEGTRLKIKFYKLLIELKPLQILHMFGDILPEYKEDSELIKRCESFLQAELQFYTEASKEKAFEVCIELRSMTTSMILDTFRSDNILALKPKFAPFIEAA